jgi:DNA-binding NarL/FixJ family response regulator
MIAAVNPVDLRHGAVPKSQATCGDFYKGLMTALIRVAVLDDHQVVIDGCRYRLATVADIAVVATANCWSEMELLLADHECEVLFMDVNVPTSPDNPLPFPILHVLGQLAVHYPKLVTVIFSMSAEPAFVRAAMAAGARGYVLKEDAAAMRQLDAVVRDVAGGRPYLSPKAEAHRRHSREETIRLTHRQLQALSLLASEPNLTLLFLAERSNVAASTMRNLLSDAYRRLGVANRGAAILRARQLGLVTPVDEKWGEAS